MKYKDWIKAYSEKRDLKNCTCPECSNDTLVLFFIGKPTDKVGYARMWCTSCLNGIHLSRVQASEKVRFRRVEDVIREVGVEPAVNWVTP